VDFRARVFDFDAEDFEPAERFEAVRVVAFADFELLLRGELFAEERDFEPALLRVVLDLDLLVLAAARLLFAFAPAREAAGLDLRPAAAVLALLVLLPVRRAPAREPLVFRVLRPRRELRPPSDSIIPAPAASPEPAVSVSSISVSISDPFLRAMSFSSKFTPIQRNTGSVTGVPQGDHFRFIRRRFLARRACPARTILPPPLARRR
jgi:hypothetical protein